MKTILVDAVWAFVIKGEGIYEPMHKLLEEYPNRKILLTGADDKQMVDFGLDKMPYEVFTLKHNPEKTDPKYYEVMLKHFNLNKDDVVYFEHAAEAVKSAQSVGITTYFYDQDKKDIEGLKKFLDKNL
jgi:HAD superfamily hydrolase (TIGR01509 family)